MYFEPIKLNETFIMNFLINKLIKKSQTLPEFNSSGAFAANYIGQNSSSDFIDINHFLNKSELINLCVQISDLNGKLICADKTDDFSWIKLIQIAKDCQSSNIILSNTKKGLILKSIQVIAPGDPLLLWFAEDVCAMMKIPFLITENIIGDNRYICHKCKKLFEDPNPLKLHLALKCNQLDVSNIWIELANELKTSSPSSKELRKRCTPVAVVGTENVLKTPPASPLSLSLTYASSNSSVFSTSEASLHQNSLSNVNPSVNHFTGQNSSAFRPFLPQKVTENIYQNQSATPTPPPLPLPAPPSSLVLSESSMKIETHAAQMETLFSNLGKLKNGHVCFYCGKIYSRKYGLKIHIRTHTHYKPLKCKFCSRAFGDPSNLNKHVRLHVDSDTRYKCQICEKVLVRRRDFERHIKSRHPDIEIGQLDSISLN